MKQQQNYSTYFVKAFIYRIELSAGTINLNHIQSRQVKPACFRRSDAENCGPQFSKCLFCDQQIFRLEIPSGKDRDPVAEDASGIALMGEFFQLCLRVPQNSPEERIADHGPRGVDLFHKNVLVQSLVRGRPENFRAEGFTAENVVFEPSVITLSGPEA